MGRPRTFDVDAVTAAAASAFRRLGYEGTSVDDLVTATGLHRGSLYGAFGSKRGLFVTALRAVVDVDLPAALSAGGGHDLVEGEALDLVLVAALELAPRDEETRDLVRRASDLLAVAAPRAEAGGGAGPLGRRLLHRAGVVTSGAPVPPTGPITPTTPTAPITPTDPNREATP